MCTYFIVCHYFFTALTPLPDHLSKAVDQELDSYLEKGTVMLQAGLAIMPPGGWDEQNAGEQVRINLPKAFSLLDLGQVLLKCMLRCNYLQACMLIVIINIIIVHIIISIIIIIIIVIIIIIISTIIFHSLLYIVIISINTIIMIKTMLIFSSLL